ncbi:MAG: TIR domain-containing protein [Actinobacteria bacterium]|nr:TIR domain-containing protein [Actinomycetota bacterium]MCG2807319.1 TIR domain-containing protein [Coriobacteriia bacterium]
MKIFMSHSSHDRGAAARIADVLVSGGHEVLSTVNLRAGSNISRRVRERVTEADVVLALISRDTFRSEHDRGELTALAMGRFARDDQVVIPLLLDDSAVPSYLSDYLYLDFSQDFEDGLQHLVRTLANLPAPAAHDVEVRRARKRESDQSQLGALKDELRAGRLTLVCGAGVSVAAGIPDWNELLVRLLERMIQRIAANHPNEFHSVSGVELQKQYGASALIIGKYLKNNLGGDFATELRDALYVSQPTSCELIEAIGHLARPQRDGKPLDSIITFNFDSLIEEHLDSQNVRNKPIHSEAVKHRSDELPVYHVHGYLPRGGKMRSGTEVVFSEDAYHSQFIDSFSWSNLIQLTKLTQNTCLFVGLSLTDPNLRRLLDVAQRKNPEKALAHYIIKKTPRFDASSHAVASLGRLLEEQDANALGLNVIWVNDFSEIPVKLRTLSVG